MVNLGVKKVCWGGKCQYATHTLYICKNIKLFPQIIERNSVIQFPYLGHHKANQDISDAASGNHDVKHTNQDTSGEELNQIEAKCIQVAC